jgi:cell division protein FtsB
MIIKQNRGRQWLDWQRRVLSVAQVMGAGVCVWLAAALLFGEMGLPRYWSMRDHAGDLERTLQSLRGENTALRSEVARLQHDTSKIEQLARERLGYVRRGETVYQFAPEVSQESQSQERR